MVKCHGCGIEKDPNQLEVYPYPEEDRFIIEPIRPLFHIDCQPQDDEDGWRQVTVCHECFHKLDPDQWIGSRCWLGLQPVTPFKDLPPLEPGIQI